MSELFRQQIADLQRRVIALEERAAKQEAAANAVLYRLDEPKRLPSTGSGSVGSIEIPAPTKQRATRG